jgi:hypothetical protein
MVSRLSLGVRCPPGTCDQFYSRLENFFRQLRVCNFVAPSLTRGRVCNLLYNCFWALPEQSLLRRSPAEPTAIFYCLIWDSPNMEGQVPVFISPRNRVAQLFPLGTGLLTQTTLLAIQSWLRDWRIKANETKSVHVTFTTRCKTCPPIHINDVQIPREPCQIPWTSARPPPYLAHTHFC